MLDCCISVVRVAATITLLALPPKCPEHNPAKNDWQFILDNWNTLIAQLLLIMSTSLGDWGTRVMINADWFKPSLNHLLADR